MSTKEDQKSAEAETKEAPIDPETGLPEGLDPGQSWMDQSPVTRSEPIPLPYGSRLVGLTAEEAHELLLKEQVAALELRVEEEKDSPETAEEELAAAKKELAAAKTSTPKPTANRNS